MTAESESAEDSILAHLEGSAEVDIALASEDTSRCFKLVHLSNDCGSTFPLKRN